MHTTLCLRGSTFKYHTDLFKPTVEQLEALKVAVNKMDTTDKEGYILLNPPVFRQEGSCFTLVANLLTFSLVTGDMDLDKKFQAMIMEKRDCPDSRVQTFQKQDSRSAKVLLHADSDSLESISAPTRVKRKRIACGQICPKCKEKGNIVPLSGPNNAKAITIQGNGGTLKCSKCPFTLEVTPSRLLAFVTYQASTEELMEKER